MNNAENPDTSKETSLLDELKLGYNDLSHKDKENFYNWVIAKRTEEIKERVSEKYDEVAEKTTGFLKKAGKKFGENLKQTGEDISDIFKS